MNQQQLKQMQSGKGFVAALDQSGGSTPGALALYGLDASRYNDEEEMFSLMHEMRSRMIKSPSFSSERILAAILFAGTMRREIDGMPTAQYLWEEKGIVPLLKIDEGMEEMQNGVRLMKDMRQLDELLAEAQTYGIFGTKMRSFIAEANPVGIRQIVSQQFDYADRVMQMDMVPIIEPEVDIHSASKSAAETILLEALTEALESLPPDAKVMFKLSIPSTADHYAPLMKYPQVVRVLALSGGYSREEADALLAQNHGMIASFSRALAEGLRASQSDADFDAMLADSIRSIYDASIT